ncbi:MAG TPA: GNAT family N-acetyltransferase, partial [Clostridiales bacterium]|nr:GNAT family N-acetyltransferase [Clostridiales bacterium]
NELEMWKAFPFDDESLAIEYNGFMTTYFHDVYGGKEDLFYKQCVFVRNVTGKPVATCFSWKAYKRITTIHWLKVKKEYENQGIGRALLSKILLDLGQEDYPVYLHTHPGSFRAIGLYSDFGFVFITNDNVGHRENGLYSSLPYLKQHMSEAYYNKISFTQAPPEFIKVVSSSDIHEF